MPAASVAHHGALLTGVGSLPERLKAGVARFLPSGLSVTALALCTWLSFHFGQGFAFTGFLYLVLVVLEALYGGFWHATVISIAAAACLNYFFVPPIFSFANTAANWVALGAFEFTALVISRLSLRARVEATEAIAGRREMERLYEVSRRILLLDGTGDLGDYITAVIREVFELQAVQLFDALPATTYQVGSGPAGGERKTRDAYIQEADSFDSETRSWYCVLRLRTRPVGGLALHDARMTKLAATALASLCAIALERGRAIQRESRAEAARQTEQLRTAVLDALAHQFKTPLSIVRTASSGLLAIGGLSELQADLVTSIDQQAAKIDHLASRLLTAAKLEAIEFKPQREPQMLSTLVERAIRKLERQADRERFQVSLPIGEVAVLADPELILTSLAQLVDNAVQYSEPGSPIEVTFALNEGRVMTQVLSRGSIVRCDDRERIFERFYRAQGTPQVPAGTGLGLSIVKKIVEAHHGNVWAEGIANYGTAFSMSLPRA